MNPAKDGGILYKKAPPNLSPNGPPAYDVCPEPIKRARDKDMRGFAGEGNVVEAERALCERSETERPMGFQGLSVGRLLGAGSSPHLYYYSFFAPNARRARREDTSFIP